MQAQELKYPFSNTIGIRSWVYFFSRLLDTVQLVKDN